MKFLIVGIGNPGPEYEDTRHNVGFMVADSLLDRLGAGDYKDARYGWMAHNKFKGRQVVILKPSTYVNRSGQAVHYWLQKEKIPIDRCLVVVDDLALPFGKLRLRTRGSDGGHNGLKDVEARLGTRDYARLRFGIGSDYPKGTQVNYVLSPFDEKERSELPDHFKKAVNVIQDFLFSGPTGVTNFSV